MTQPSGRGGKSRIVIDVARAQAEARAGRGRRFGRLSRYLSVTSLIIVGVVVVLLASGYAWWRSYKRSPAYSLALLVDAAQHDDRARVESLIDADKIAQGFVPQVIDKLAGANSPLTAQARASLTNALPALLPRVSETMRDEIAASVKGLSKNSTSSTPFFVKAFAMRSAFESREQGDAATLVLKSGDRPVELTMRRDGERWKLVGVKDDKMAADIATRLASSIPASQPAQKRK